MGKSICLQERGKTSRKAEVNSVSVLIKIQLVEPKKNPTSPKVREVGLFKILFCVLLAPICVILNAPLVRGAAFQGLESSGNALGIVFTDAVGDVHYGVIGT